MAAGLEAAAGAAQCAERCQRRAGSGMAEASHARESGSRAAAGVGREVTKLAKDQSVRAVLRRAVLRAMVAEAAQEAAPSTPTWRRMAEARPNSLASRAILKALARSASSLLPESMRIGVIWRRRRRAGSDGSLWRAAMRAMAAARSASAGELAADER